MWLAVYVASALAFGCGGGGHGGGGGSTESAVRAYTASDACHEHTDPASCGASASCVWSAVESCPANVTCPPGICVAVDPCAAHDDRASCEAAGCAWAGLGTALAACADGKDCNGGACYTRGGGDGCLCACPAYCPAGADCPPCDCDCAPGGGGTCTCACAPCAPGATCPPCDCTCDGDGGGSGGNECGDTCVCHCPECLVGESCPPCDCNCGGGSIPPPAPPPTRTCECPPCVPGDACAPCDCGTTDACGAHTDAEACRADGANACVWFVLGRPCEVGVPCISGVCQHESATGGPNGGGCVCACPACVAGETCPPCDCDCTDGPGTAGCTPRPVSTPGPPPSPGPAVSSRAG